MSERPPPRILRVVTEDEPVATEAESKFRPTKMQTRFRETFRQAMEEGVVSLSAWCQMHSVRQAETIPTRTVQGWLADANFKEWLDEVAPPPVSDYERELADRITERTAIVSAASLNNDDPTAPARWEQVRKRTASKPGKKGPSRDGVLAQVRKNNG